MIILSWNVRGLESPKKRALIKGFLASTNPSIVILRETKTSTVDRRFIKSLWSSRFIGWAVLEANGASGGIIIMCNELNIDMSDPIIYTFSLSLKLTLADGFTFWITSVYSPNSITERKNLWKELSDLSTDCLPNWVIGVILTPLDGLGRSPIVSLIS